MVLFECLHSAEPNTQSTSKSRSKPRYHPVWINQQEDEAYAQDISQAGVAHISFVKKKKKKNQIFDISKKVLK